MINKQQTDLGMESLQPDYLRIIRWIGLVVVTILSVVFGVLWSIPWYFATVGWIVVLAVLFLLLNAYLKHWYQKYSYQLDDERLAINRGVFWQHQVAIPISRVQHVDVNSGPLDRRYDLAKLVVNTAGTHYAQTSLPGLSVEQAHELRDQLLTMQEGDTV